MKNPPEIPVMTEPTNDVRTVLRNASWGESVQLSDEKLLPKVTVLPSNVMTEDVELDVSKGEPILGDFVTTEKGTKLVGNGV
jgi:hypothetical protein